MKNIYKFKEEAKVQRRVPQISSKDLSTWVTNGKKRYGKTWINGYKNALYNSFYVAT